MSENPTPYKKWLHFGKSSVSFADALFLAYGYANSTNAIKIESSFTHLFFEPPKQEN